MSKFDGLPKTILPVVKAILSEETTDKNKAAKLYRINTVFIHKGMVGQILERSSSWAQSNLKGVF